MAGIQSQTMLSIAFGAVSETAWSYQCQFSVKHDLDVKQDLDVKHDLYVILSEFCIIFSGIFTSHRSVIDI